jgi:plastocyanin
MIEDIVAISGFMTFWACQFPAVTWEATAGAESSDKGIQALAFLPNGLWIHVGDSITWTFPTPEIHTVTFLDQDTTPEQIRPPRPGVMGRRPIIPGSIQKLA